MCIFSFLFLWRADLCDAATGDQRANLSTNAPPFKTRLAWNLLHISRGLLELVHQQGGSTFLELELNLPLRLSAATVAWREWMYSFILTKKKLLEKEGEKKEREEAVRERKSETERASSCGNISNIYSPPPSAVARAFEEQSNIRRWSEDSPFKPQGFIWERIPSVRADLQPFHLNPSVF